MASDVVMHNLNPCKEISEMPREEVNFEGSYPTGIPEEKMKDAREVQSEMDSIACDPAAACSSLGAVTADDQEKPNSVVQDKEEKYAKLIELLTKSRFYSKFLLDKIEQTRKEKQTKRKKKQASGPPSKRAKINNSGEQMMEIAEGILTSKNNEPNKEGVPSEDLDKSFEEGKEIPDTKELPDGLTVPASQPNLLSGVSLRDYQVEGFEWLKALFENGVNGILADEMGLGKTVQVIALLAHLVERKMSGPYLVIAPLSTLPNWLIEFNRFAPTLPVVLYHGNPEKLETARREIGTKASAGELKGKVLKTFPIVVTSYECALKKPALRKFAWQYIIVDEGHRLKNHESQLSQTMRLYKSDNRLILTGTPLHNNLKELWALLNFLVPEIFDSFDIFESLFDVTKLENDNSDEHIIEEEKERKVISTMHQILSPFMLRRVKDEVNLNLPPKRELIVYAPMTPLQLDLYNAVLDYNISKLTNKPDDPIIYEKRTKRKCTLGKKNYVIGDFDLEEIKEYPAVNKIIVQDKENKDYAIGVKMQNTAMMMRKIVNHPYLVQYPLIPGTPYARIDEEIVRTSGKLMVLDAMLTKLKARNHKVLLFSTFVIMLDILEDYLSLRDYTYTRLDGTTDIEDRQVMIHKFNSDPDQFLFLISTRAGGLGINLASADTVILFDSDWNPQVDLQAQDRCHRIGQTKPVLVYRFITAGTIDERIVVRGCAKRKLEKMIIQKGLYSSLRSRNVSTTVDLLELRKLLKKRDHQRIIHPNGFVFSDEELEELLDRSKMQENTTSSEESVQQRSFKEFYGYTGGLKDAHSTTDILGNSDDSSNESTGNVQQMAIDILDALEDSSNDSAVKPLKKPLEKNSVRENEIISTGFVEDKPRDGDFSLK